MKTRLYLLLFMVLTVLLNSFINKPLQENLEGKWKTTCDNSSGFVNIINEENIIIEVNSNQIYIKARAKYRFYSPSITIMEIFLVEPDDLGLGGMKLNWNGFSGTHKIAEIRAFKNQSVEFQWFGFYDKEKKKYVWERKMDFLLKSPYEYPVCLKKCTR